MNIERRIRPSSVIAPAPVSKFKWWARGGRLTNAKNNFAIANKPSVGTQKLRNGALLADSDNLDIIDRRALAVLGLAFDANFVARLQFHVSDRSANRGV